MADLPGTCENKNPNNIFEQEDKKHHKIYKIQNFTINLLKGYLLARYRIPKFPRIIFYDEIFKHVKFTILFYKKIYLPKQKEARNVTDCFKYQSISLFILRDVTKMYIIICNRHSGVKKARL